MTPALLKLLCDPQDGSLLTLEKAVYDEEGNIISGMLNSVSGRHWPIINGIPRFIDEEVLTESVDSFGDEWNTFNFDTFKQNWLTHTIKNTFGSTEVFRDKVVVDAGAGSGMQSVWIHEAGARHVISLELSHSVDGIMQENLKRGLCDRVDVVQCSIDAPPMRAGGVDMVYCHNVIQHTPSVEKTAHALWPLVANGGEFVFNCYPKNDLGWLRKLRLAMQNAVRAFLSRRSFRFIHNYARIMACLRFIPLLGWFLEKSTLMFRGDVPQGKDYWQRAYQSGVLNTYDWFGSHRYQHYKTDEEIRHLVQQLQPESGKVKNVDRYFTRPQPIGIALRLFR